MKIIRKNIRTPQRYLFALHPGDKFYVAAPLSDEDLQKLRPYGIAPGKPARIPIARRSATKYNADGKWILLKDLPKEERTFAHSYHLKDWQGGDIYGTYYQSRMCYQRKLIPPTELAFIIENGTLYSPLLENNVDDMQRIKVAMNVILEMLGHCEILTADKAPALPPVKQVEVPWEILRSGTRDRVEWKHYLEKTTERKAEAQKVEIYKRHETVMNRKPEFVVIGKQNFFGYVVYGFPTLNLFIFESNEINNATYAFRGDWESASKLTKTEILAGGLQEARIFHTQQWPDNLGKLFSRIYKEVA